MGRPRGFDTDVALRKALHVFWRKGFDGASLNDLTSAMGINRPSMYAAFGDKEMLFRRVLERYGDEPGMQVHAELAAPTAREGVERLLRSTVDRATDPTTPPGCLLVHGALVAGRGGEAVRDELAARRRRELDAVRQRLRRAVDGGELPADSDVEALARFVTVLGDGLAVAAVGGAPAGELHRTVEHAMRAWPAPR